MLQAGLSTCCKAKGGQNVEIQLTGNLPDWPSTAGWKFEGTAHRVCKAHSMSGYVGGCHGSALKLALKLALFCHVQLCLNGTVFAAARCHRTCLAGLSAS